MVFDKVATDKRRIQDSQGDELCINKTGFIFTDEGDHGRTSLDVRFYYGHEFTSVSAGSTVTVTICTNEKFPHGQFLISSDNAFSFDLELSNAACSAINGTQDYQFNVNRGKNNARSVASFYFGDTSASTSGFAWKTLESGYIAEGKFSTPDKGSTVDWMLDSERVYHLKITNNGADAAWICVKYLYHEHYPVNMVDVPGDGEDEDEYNHAIT